LRLIAAEGALARAGLFVGLALVALGSGGIKPCVSAVLGDQFGELNQHLVSVALIALDCVLVCSGLHRIGELGLG
jgi:dipeptide/tripeptide permease